VPLTFVMSADKKSFIRSMVETEVTSVSYGGLKKGNGDVTMAGIPAPVRTVKMSIGSFNY